MLCVSLVVNGGVRAAITSMFVVLIINSPQPPEEYGVTVTVTPASTLKTPEILYIPVSVVFDVIMRSPGIGVVEHWAKVSIEIPEESNSKRRE